MVGFWNFHQNSVVTDQEMADIPELKRITRTYLEVSEIFEGRDKRRVVIIT